jgi:hypothetical protein
MKTLILVTVLTLSGCAVTAEINDRGYFEITQHAIKGAADPLTRASNIAWYHAENFCASYDKKAYLVSFEPHPAIPVQAGYVTVQFYCAP